MKVYTPRELSEIERNLNSMGLKIGHVERRGPKARVVFYVDVELLAEFEQYIRDTYGYLTYGAKSREFEEALRKYIG